MVLAKAALAVIDEHGEMKTEDQGARLVDEYKAIMHSLPVDLFQDAKTKNSMITIMKNAQNPLGTRYGKTLMKKYKEHRTAICKIFSHIGESFGTMKSGAQLHNVYKNYICDCFIEAKVGIHFLFFSMQLIDLTIRLLTSQKPNYAGADKRDVMQDIPHSWWLEDKSCVYALLLMCHCTNNEFTIERPVESNTTVKDQREKKKSVRDKEHEAVKQRSEDEKRSTDAKHNDRLGREQSLVDATIAMGAAKREKLVVSTIESKLNLLERAKAHMSEELYNKRVAMLMDEMFPSEKVEEKGEEKEEEEEREEI